MKAKGLFLLFVLAMSGVFAQEKSTVQWIDALSIGLEGQGWDKNLAHPYDRLPAKAEATVRKPLWDLSNQTAGMALHFYTNSKDIHVKVKTRFNGGMPHMTAVAVKGFDLYAKDGEQWRWAGATKPYGQESNAVIVGGMDGHWREYILYLPTYDGVEHLEIGINEKATLRAFDADNYNGKPIVFYGTSIMQGCSASRPGLISSNQLGRLFNREVINLGFSGNGRMEQALADLINELDASVLVLDCLPNMTAEMVQERFVPFIKAIRKKHKDLPIVVVGAAGNQNKWLVKAQRDKYLQEKAMLEAQFTQCKMEGDLALYYVSGDALIGTDSDGTIDGIHYNDLGYQHYVNTLHKMLITVLK